MKGEKSNKKNIESLDFTQKVNLLKLWSGNYKTNSFLRIIEQKNILLIQSSKGKYEYNSKKLLKIFFKDKSDFK